MATTDITISAEDLVKGDEIVAYTAWNFDHGTQAITGSWVVDSVHWMASDRLADVYTNRGLLGFRRGGKVTVRRETASEPQAETVEQPTKGQQFAKTMRYFLSIGTRTRRDRNGHDLHREIAEWTVTAAMHRGTFPPAEEAVFAAAFDAASTWAKDIKNGRGSWIVIEHIDQMSPWQFCKLLGDMVDAGVNTTSAGAQYFARMRTQLLAQAA
ncbi:hypothetical protein OG819_42650 [Streptomyces sp. NBC_01549]|uniref:hypothetical protein n=1 Tax=Streptomyces sp. NBC_01549 TaxID=2975874 RepID=UPI00225BB766|nr:hypothetical protein [Streptomyces sp. NBC_01549]MCX4596117.1 hypothetical protein [Streptomyces sp. NBC_01549]